jgi:GH24 family phage-related lysozyme (muramidase)
MSTDLVPLDRANGLAEFAAPTGVEAVRQSMEALKAIRTFIKAEFVAGLDYGVIPGTGTKPALLKPGAEKAVMYFNAAPRFKIERNEMGEGHVEFIVTTRLISRVTGRTIGEGVGSCSTMEKKYRWRGGSRKCPQCGAPAIFKSKQEYGGGFYCNGKVGGCGAKFRANDQSITGQSEERAENPDIYDVRNTVLKMAKKRSLVDAALGLGCLSEIYSQDIDETYDLNYVEPEAPPEPDQRKKANRPSNDSGHASGQYASPEQIRAYLDALRSFCERFVARWLDTWTDHGGVHSVIESGPILWREPLNVHQADGHLLKACVEAGHLDRRIVPENAKARQLGAYVAIVYHRGPELHEWLVAELNAYARAQHEHVLGVIYERHPELRPADDGDQPTAPDPEDDGPVAGEDD